MTAAAREMRARRRSQVLPIISLAHTLNIDVCIQGLPQGEKLDAHIDLDGERPTIALYRTANIAAARRLDPEKESELTPRERFSIAHEIGHWLAFDRCGLRPHPTTDHDAYWADEKLCDTFANMLLVPDWQVDGWLAPISAGVGIVPAQLRRWAASARVSRPVVANAIVRRRNDIGFIQMTSRVGEGRASSIFVVEFSTAGRDVSVPARKTHMRDPELNLLVSDKPDGATLMQRCRLGRCPEQALKLAWESRSRPSSARSPGLPATTTWLSLARPRTDQMTLPL